LSISKNTNKYKLIFKYGKQLNNYFSEKLAKELPYLLDIAKNERYLILTLK